MPCDYHLLPHAGIQSLKPYIPGKSAAELAEELGSTDIIKLASNENPLGCSPLVTKAMATLSCKQISTYTVAANHPLREKLAKKLGINSEMITFGNGSDVLIPLLQSCFALHCDKHILTHNYAFISYTIYADSLGIPIKITPLLTSWRVDIDAMIASCNEKTALIFMANPNNPTGLLSPQADIERLLDNIPATTILVLDEAYYEYVDDADKLKALSLLARYPNLVITRTFSKAYGLAGLRLGYAIASAYITALLHRVIPPFSVNEAALVAGHAALDDDEFIQRSIKSNKEGLKQLQKGLDQCEITYLPTAGNFITFDCKMDATPLYQDLLQHGIIVRPLQPYGLNNYLRVTIGTQQQNSRFLDALKNHKK